MLRSLRLPTPPLPPFPGPLSLPLGLIPVRTHSAVMARVLNRLFAPELAEGELDFLEGRVMRIGVTDARLAYHLTLEGNRLQAADGARPFDLEIQGGVHDFLLLATRREDADTLFFNRRLRLGGDTELGLYVKNFLDSLELDQRLGPLLKLLNGATDVVGRLNRT
ncbi:MAG TPA: sterol-binding protein [Sedimenticola thiotaurini]|uniref:Ubiquinone biosynthesis accessory factor UbiT n=1 Tax=Sedimenticola thiotaurini TaxID=1543721 RepID=A0A831RM11_9GAMM|nr:sterol-binding protein [Sedimenticola thiotaurini]